MYLKELAGIGVLEDRQEGPEKLFMHPKLMRLMTRDQNELVPYPA